MTAPTTVEFLFDIGSPNAHLVHRVIPTIEARGVLRFAYRPILLGGLFKLANSRSPMQAYADIPNKWAYERLEMQRFIQRHRIAFRLNPHFPVNTLLAMRVATAAAQRNADEATRCIEGLFAAMWERDAKLDDPAVLAASLTASGLDAAGLLDAAQQEPAKAALLQATQQAHARGAFGAPTFFVGDEMWFGKERLAEIEATFVP